MTYTWKFWQYKNRQGHDMAWAVGTPSPSAEKSSTREPDTTQKVSLDTPGADVV